MAELFKCDIPEIDESLERVNSTLDDAKRADINRRIQNTLRRLEAVSATQEEMPSLTPAIRQAAEQQFRNVMQIASNVQRNPGNARSLAFQLAQTLGINKMALTLRDTFTDEGFVRHLLTELRRRGTQSAESTLSSIGMIDRAIAADNVLAKLKPRSVRQDDWNKLILDAYEIGWMPYAQRDLGIVGPEGIMALRGRQKLFMQKLQELSIPQNVADQIARQVAAVHETYRSSLEIMAAFGVDINDADGLMRYLPRNFSPETLRRFHWESLQNGEYKVFGFNGQTTKETFSSTFTRARKSDIFIVEDKILLNEILRGADPDLETRFGGARFADYIENTEMLTREFVEVLDKSPRTSQVFDALVESGFISKIPMTGNELYTYMSKRLDLPFETIDEFMPSTFRERAAIYEKQASDLVGKSFRAQFTAKAAIEGSWGATRAQVLADPDLYKGWKTLTSTLESDPDSVIDLANARRFGINPEVGKDVYVHPVVAQLYQARTQVLSSPPQLANIGKLFSDIRRNFVAMALGTTGFVFKQGYNLVFQNWAAGGSVTDITSTVSRGLTQLAKLKKKGISFESFYRVWDDSRAEYLFKDGQTITEQEMWIQAQRAGMLEEVIPWLGIDNRTASFKPSVRGIDAPSGVAGIPARRKEAMRRQLRYMAAVLNSEKAAPPISFAPLFKAGEVLDVASAGGRRMSEDVFQNIALANAFFDNMGKFALLRSLTSTNPNHQLMRIAQGNFNFKGPLTLEEAIEQVNKFYPRYDNPSQFDEFAQFVMPFWMFTSRNTGNMFRFLVQNPSKFVNYHRVQAAARNPDRNEDPLPYGVLRDWQQDTSPLTWIIRDENGAPVEVIAFPWTPIDPITEGTNSFTGIADSVLDSFGIWPGRANRKIGDTLGSLSWADTQTNSALRSLLEDAHVDFKFVASFLLGEDISTGMPLRGPDAKQTSILGVSVTPMQRYAIETFLPTARNINKSNPFGIFGRPARYDSKGNKIADAQPAWFWGTERDPRDSARDFRTWWQRSLDAMGFSNYTLDVIAEMGYREYQFSREMGAAEEAIATKRREIARLGGDEQAQNRALLELFEMQAILAGLAIDYENIKAWGEQRGLDTAGAIRSLRNQEERLSNIDAISDERAVEILRSVYGEQLGDNFSIEDMRQTIERNRNAVREGIE